MTTLPTTCPRCLSTRTIHLSRVKTSTCRDCDLSWWWSNDDGRVVTDGADAAWPSR